MDKYRREFPVKSIYESTSYLTGNTLRLRYRAQPVNALYCENRTEHTDTLCGQNAVYINSVRTSQETHHVTATLV
jgi:hypothetical protein